LATFHDAAKAVAELVRRQPRGTHWLLACDTDADGLCAAAVTAQALTRLGHRFTVRADRAKDEAAYRAAFEAPAQGIVFLDKGTSHAQLIGQLAAATKRIAVILDHHNIDAPAAAHAATATFAILNPRLCGLDGSRDASAATTSVAFALALVGDAAWSGAAIALSGAIGDWQHHPDWTGWNREILERGREKGLVVSVTQPRFIGADLAEAMARFQPAIPGIHGDPAAAWSMIEQEGLDPACEVEDLSAEQQARLVAACALRFLKDGRKEDIARLVGPVDHNARLGTGLRHVFRIVDACGREGQAATGIAYLLGDAAAKGEAMACLARYKAALVLGLRALRDAPPAPLRAVRWAWTQNADYTGMVAGVAITVMMTDKRTPLCILAKRNDGLVQVSTRGTETQVKRGLDLGAACKLAAAAVGREGGGHPVAAGAVVPETAVQAFLAALDDTLVAQRFLEAVPT
jgi:RecJ-like exonuclease